MPGFLYFFFFLLRVLNKVDSIWNDRPGFAMRSTAQGLQTVRKHAVRYSRMSLIHRNAGKPQCRLAGFVDYGLGGHSRGSQPCLTRDSSARSGAPWVREGAARGTAALLSSKGLCKQRRCCYRFFFRSYSSPESPCWSPLSQLKPLAPTCCAATLRQGTGCPWSWPEPLSCSEPISHGYTWLWCASQSLRAEAGFWGFLGQAVVMESPMSCDC